MPTKSASIVQRGHGTRPARGGQEALKTLARQVAVERHACPLCTTPARRLPNQHDGRVAGTVGRSKNAAPPLHCRTTTARLRCCGNLLKRSWHLTRLSASRFRFQAGEASAPWTVGHPSVLHPLV